MLKALPNRSTRSNYHLYDMFNFKNFQESLVAYQTEDIVESFEHYDQKS